MTRSRRTSRDARPDAEDTLRKILRLLSDEGPLTAREAALLLGGDVHLGSARTSDLRAMGLVRVVGRRINPAKHDLTADGAVAEVLGLTDLGRDYLAGEVPRPEPVTRSAHLEHLRDTAFAWDLRPAGWKEKADVRRAVEALRRFEEEDGKERARVETLPVEPRRQELVPRFMSAGEPR